MGDEPGGRRLTAPGPRRPLVAFFDYPDVFEDFYPHYGVDQKAFASRWSNTWAHSFVSLLQRDLADVVWHSFSIDPQLRKSRHETTGCTVRFIRSSLAHRGLWRLSYRPGSTWRWRQALAGHRTALSFLAMLSVDFLRQLRRERPDALLVQEYSTPRFDVLVALAHWMKIPVIAVHTGSKPDVYMARRAKKWSIPRATRFVVSSSREREMLANRFGVAPVKIDVILTPIDTDTFRPMERGRALQAVGLPSDRRYVLFVGRLDDRVKRVGSLISTFADLADEHPDVDLIVVGDGPDAVRLRNLAQRVVPHRVHFRGWIHRQQDLMHIYNAADCLVLPSMSEGFPTVVGEALACGTPVIGSDVGGVSEVVREGETGWLMAPGDDATLKRHLTEVFARPPPAAMRAGARRMAEERVSPSVVLRQLTNCLAGARSEVH